MALKSVPCHSNCRGIRNTVFEYMDKWADAAIKFPARTDFSTMFRIGNNKICRKHILSARNGLNVVLTFDLLNSTRTVFIIELRLM